MVNLFSNVIEFAPSIDPCEFLDWRLKPHRGDRVKPGAVSAPGYSPPKERTRPQRGNAVNDFYELYRSQTQVKIGEPGGVSPMALISVLADP